jgi:hypothetical protein
MPTPTLVNLSSLIDDAKCFELVRQHRWPDGVRCPSCGSSSAARYGGTHPNRIGSATVARRAAPASTT